MTDAIDSSKIQQMIAENLKGLKIDRPEQAVHGDHIPHESELGTLSPIAPNPDGERLIKLEESMLRDKSRQL